MEENDLSSESTCEKVAEFFYKKFCISEEAKNNLIKESISGDILSDIQSKDYLNFGIKGGPQQKIKKYIQENKDKKLKAKAIQENISSISNEENIKKFFERCLNFTGNLNGLTEKDFLSLDEDKMKKIGLNFGQRKKLEKYIKYFKEVKETKSFEESDFEINVSPKSSEEEIKNFLENALKLSPKLIDELAFDGESLFLLEEEGIEDLGDLSQEDKEKIKRFVIKKNKMNKKIKINPESKKEEILAFLKEKNQDINNLLQIDIDQINDISSEEKNILKAFIIREKNEKLKEEKESKEIYKKFEERYYPLNTESKYNIFFTIQLRKNNINNYTICVYYDEKNIFKHIFVYIYSYFSPFFSQDIIYFIVQVPLKKCINKLYISVKEGGNNYRSVIQMNNEENYFYLDNLDFEQKRNPFAFWDINNIILYYLMLIFDKNNFRPEKLKKDLIANISKLFEESEIKITIQVITALKYFRCCLETNSKPNLDKIVLKDLKYQIMQLEQEFYLTDKDIDDLITEKNKEKIFEVIVAIYSIFDINHMYNLLKLSKIHSDYYSKNLFNYFKKDLTKENFDLLNSNQILFIQEKFIEFAEKKEDINKIIKLSKEITSCLKFIYEK